MKKELLKKYYDKLYEINKNQNKKSFSLKLYDKNVKTEIIKIQTSEIWVDIFIEPFGAGYLINGKNYLWIWIFELKKAKTETFVFEIGKFITYKHEKFVEKLCDIEFFEYGLLEILKMVEKEDVEEIIQMY